ncbi:MAG: transaldolase family protein [Planctomycetota bacterium]
MDVNDPRLIQITRSIVLEGFEPQYDELDEPFPASALWSGVAGLGSELWLDTGDPEAIEGAWTREFSALTTNNTLLNREVQKGTYDDLVRRSAGALRAELPDLHEADLVREIAFILNAYHGLRLVERFDAHVSVEEHTDLAHDADAAVAYARRYAEICPERFYVKIPLTAAGLVAARQCARQEIPVNLTLGFSARQNVLVALIARPRFCNVFLGRLNQVVSEAGLGDGRLVGERTTVASQQAVSRLRRADEGLATRQIAASMRSGEQVRDLAGIDVLTIPPKAAGEFVDMHPDPAALRSAVSADYRPQFADDIDPGEWDLDGLWDVPDGLEDAARELASDETLDADGLLGGLAEAGFGAVLPRWTEPDVAKATSDGKIPALADWRHRLAADEAGLDALMNLHGLRSFATDQEAMDERVRRLL